MPIASPSPAEPSTTPVLTLSAMSLMVAMALTVVDVVTGTSLGELLALPFLLLYMVAEFHRVPLVPRLLCVAAFGVAVTLVVQGRYDVLLNASQRTMFLPAFMAALGLLRAAATTSEIVARAGRFLVGQKPALRYIALSFGGHIFGILLNIGGLALLIDMTRKANTLESAGDNQRVVDIRERRMTTAVARGFASIVFWSPLGIALNLVIATIPGMEWRQIGPLGMVIAVSFMGIGWLVDRLQFPPRSGSAVAVQDSEPGGFVAFLGLIGHVAMTALVTLVVEYALSLTFQKALLIAVPTYGLIWCIGSGITHQHPRPLHRALHTMTREGFARLPLIGAEVTAFAMSGFLGVALVALVPQEPVAKFFIGLGLEGGVMAALIAFMVTFMSFIGLNPLVSATILSGIIASLHLPGLSPALLTVAVVTGWAAVMPMAPLQTSTIMTANLLNRSPFEISVGWNLPFCLTILALGGAGLILFGHLL